MYQINKATTNDIQVIQDLAEKIWRPTYKAIITQAQIDYMLELMYSTAALNKQITELQHQFLILMDNEQPIGFAAYSTTDTPDVYKLHKIYLDFNYQGKGVGKLLLQEVEDQVKAHGANILELDVNKYNKAKLFYEKQGFRVSKEKDTDIGHGYLMEDFVMRKSL
ncbi:GNAT family N-acetyltransferase [Chitinophaga sp. RAB17]|uniref:GNAT family N-acetyltransferase n=1 Tax=Chitinophaga sp. RAB17 TaxID=3233049 RepID=UPI003F90C63C